MTPDAESQRDETVQASEEVHEAILKLGTAKNHDDVPFMAKEQLDRITTDLQVVRQAIQYHEQ